LKWDVIASAQKTLEREQGYIVKDWGGRLPIALAYANSYQVGMSSLALHTLYRLLNKQPQVVCERVFLSGRSRQPLITLESQHDILDCAVLAVSLSFELDYINLAALLRQAGMPPQAEQRDETYPLLLLGGPAVTANPEPLAAISDAFFIGEVEEAISPLSSLLWEAVDAPRAEVLAALARLPGVYVPSRAPLPVKRRWVRRLDDYPTASTIFTPDTEFGDMYLMEISRGCGRGCRFCLAGYTYRPPRERSLAALLAQAQEGLKQRDRIGLVGAAISDYSQIDELVAALRRLGARISVSSLRAKPLSETLVAALAESGVRTLTLAPEAGCESLRRLVNKGITEEDILAAVELAQRYRFPALKLYFMIGLPGETTDDVAAIATLVDTIRKRFSGEIAINVSPFVPKAHTPFQWAAMAAPEILEERLAALRAGLQRENAELKTESIAWSRIQGVLARGDRRLGRVLAAMEGHTSLRAWEKALREQGLEEEEYLRERSWDETLPWQVVDMGVNLDYLRVEAERAGLGLACPPCTGSGCDRCGVCKPGEGEES